MPRKTSKVTRMVRRVQRRGGGQVSVVASSWRASSPGPWRSRSMIGSAALKMPPAGATLGMVDQPLAPRGLVPVEPGVDGIGVARLEQAVLGHPVWRVARGDLEEGGAPLADVGAGIV